MSEPDGTVVHVYGLVPLDVSLSTPRGVGGSSVSLLPVEGFAALISELGEKDYGTEVWRAHAEDPRWLEHVAREHHAVLQAVVEQSDVLPLRLPGIYGTTEGLARVLREQQAALAESLAAVGGHVELGGQIFLVDRDAGSPSRQPAKSGRDYLRQRSAEAQDRDEARKRRQARVLDVHEALAHSSTRATVNPPQDPALSGRKEPMLLNAAYLVPRFEMEGFIALAERIHEELAPEGMSLEVSGPWPPYNFADLSDGVGAGESR